MPKIPSLSSIPSALNAIPSFYAKQPLLAIAAIILPIVGILGLLYLKMNSEPTEEQQSDLFEEENLNFEQILQLPSDAVNSSRANRLLDRLSFKALKEDDFDLDTAFKNGKLELAWNAATKITDIDMKIYALCRFFNHFYNPKKKSEQTHQWLMNAANSCTSNLAVHEDLYAKIFIRYLEEGSRDLAYTKVLSQMFKSDKTDKLSKKLFDACVAKEDSVIARKAVDYIVNGQLQQEYKQKYQNKWGT